MTDLAFYAAQSPVSDPGQFADRVAGGPGTLTSMRTAARELVFHYRADGDFAENGIAADRIAEIDTRYAEDMLARLVQLADVPLGQPRAPAQRLVGCCRDFTVLFLAIARAHGVPARARVGFATYFHPGWFIDHVIAEVWDQVGQRWRLVDPELADDHVAAVDGTRVDPEDVPPGRFLTGPRAWRACRAGAIDAARFVVAPELDLPVTRGWPYVRHNLVHDLAALAKQEMLLWDNWGLTQIVGEPSADQLAALDALAAATGSSEVPLEQIQSFFQLEGLRVPPVVTSYSPASAVPLQVPSSREGAPVAPGSGP
jgi:Transglutaminase-like superfamily